MKLTDRLKVEHGIFLKQLSFLEGLAKLGAPDKILATVAETVIVAEEEHAQIEDRLLYPELRKASPSGFEPLDQVAADHAALAALVARIRGGECSPAVVLEFVETMRVHLEREIHALFKLADEWIPAERLEAMCRWDEEHLYESLGQRDVWAERWLGIRRS